MLRKVQRIIFSALIVLLVCGKVFAQSEVHVKISTAGIEPMDIAVLDFVAKNENSTAQETDLAKSLTNIIKQDLLYALVFNLVDADSFAYSILKQDWFNFDGWVQLGTRTLVSGKVEVRKNEFLAEVQLYDVYRKKKIFSEIYKTAVTGCRTLAHAISDDIVYKLTGEKGIFSSKIAFISDRSGYKELYTCDYDGENPRQLTNQQTINLSPRWSPNGKMIVYTSYKNGNPDLWLLTLGDNRNRVISSHSGLNSAPAWSPDGRYLAMTLSKDGDAEVYLISPEGVVVRRLTDSWGIDSSPTWSPSGKEIAFTSDRGGLPQVYVMSSDGGNVRRLTYENDYNDSPAWSPKGDKVLFVSRLNNGFQIYSIDVTGENLRRLTLQGSNENPHWSPDGLHIVFSSNRSGKYQIYTMNWDGSEQKIISNEGNNYNPDWSNRF